MATNDTKKEDYKIKRRKQQRGRLNRRLDYLEKQGITSSITYKGQSYTPRQLARKSEDFITKAVKAEKQRQRVDEARRYAKALGASDTDIKKVRSYKQATTLNIYDETVFKSEKYLSVAWHDITGETNLINSINKAKKMTAGQLLKKLKQMYADDSEAVKLNMINSDKMQGVQYLYQSDSKDDCIKELDALNNRGYGYTESYHNGEIVKTPISTYKSALESVSVSNEFTVKGMLNLMYVIMSNTSSIYSVQFYNDIEAFTKNYCKPIYIRIFT